MTSAPLSMSSVAASSWCRFVARCSAVSPFYCMQTNMDTHVTQQSLQHPLSQWDSPRWHSSHPHRAQVEACTTERDRRMLRCEVVCSVYPGNPTGHQQMVETDSRPAALPLPTYHHRSVDVQLLGLQYGGCEFHVLQPHSHMQRCTPHVVCKGCISTEADQVVDEPLVLARRGLDQWRRAVAVHIIA